MKSSYAYSIFLFLIFGCHSFLRNLELMCILVQVFVGFLLTGDVEKGNHFFMQIVGAGLWSNDCLHFTIVA